MDTKSLKGRTSKWMLSHIPRILMIAVTLSALVSCGRQTSQAPRILKEGDNLNGMLLISGTTGAPPLEVFCQIEPDEDATDTINCQVPALPKLQIGHLIGLKSDAFQALDWSNLDWQVYLDDYRLDLKTFKEQSYLEPALLSTPAPVREVFKHGRTWNVVLVNPTFGLHTLLCTVRDKSVVYSWVVSFMIKSTRGPGNMVDRLPEKPAAWQGIRIDIEEMEMRKRR
jgi:hypothetical protein